MGGACSTHDKDEKCIQNAIRKTSRQEIQVQTGDKIKLDLKNKVPVCVCVCVHWIQLAQDSV
jgi:hypothetical protein